MPIRSGAEIVRTRSANVLSWLTELVDRLPVPATHRALLRVHLEVGRAQIGGPATIAATQLPSIVYAALAGHEAAALPLAGACTLLYLGADLLDDVADGDVRAPWHGRSGAEMALAASTYLAPLYQIALGELSRSAGLSDARLWSMACLFRDALLEISAGQHEDLCQPDQDDVSPEASRFMVERKSGAELGLFAQAAASLATNDPVIAAHFAEFGRCMGTASQIGSDVADIWSDGPSRDLINGKRTLPVAHALAAESVEERRALRSLLAHAREDSGLHDAVRMRLERAGSLRYTGLVIELYRQRARRSLDAALTGAQGHAGAIAELYDMVAGLGLLPTPVHAATAAVPRSTPSLETRHA